MDGHTSNSLQDQERALETSKVDVVQSLETTSKEHQTLEKAGHADEEQAEREPILDGDQR